MKRIALVPVLAAALLGAGAATSAEAGIGFSVRGGFHVGDVHFDLGVHHPGPFFRPGYFYRVRGPLHYRGHDCGSACYRHHGVTYHHQACPLVLHHFRSHAFVPPHFDHRYDRYGGRSFDRYGFWYDRGRGRGHDPRYHPRRHRYDRRHDYRYDRRHRHDRRHDYRYDRRHDYRYDRRHDRCDRHYD